MGLHPYLLYKKSVFGVPYCRRFRTSFFIGPRCPWGPIYGSASLSQTELPCADLTDVTLADKDTNSILTDNAKRAFQGNVATRVTQPGGQLWNQAMQVT